MALRMPLMHLKLGVDGGAWQDQHDKLKLEEIEYVFTSIVRLHLTSDPATATTRMTMTKMTNKGVNNRSPLQTPKSWSRTS